MREDQWLEKIPVYEFMIKGDSPQHFTVAKMHMGIPRSHILAADAFMQWSRACPSRKSLTINDFVLVNETDLSRSLVDVL
jgi:hypothetical protein